jgi:pyridoxal phosphate enzyme (YggS family)
MELALLTIGERVKNFRARVDAVAAAAGRPPDSVRILGVTKMQPRESVLAALDAGLTDIGENYFQEARDKLAALPTARTHFIGHMQTNKAKPIAALFDVVQSVDRLDAGLALAKAARASGKPLSVLVQVNISPSERFGVAPDEAAGLAARLRDEGLIVDGVMAIGPITENLAETDAAFARAADIFGAVGGATLSLGMSGDWERAIVHGSTMIRLGTAIFGPRPARERIPA